jgi:hypothetical protein
LLAMAQFWENDELAGGSGGNFWEQDEPVRSGGSGGNFWEGDELAEPRKGSYGSMLNPVRAAAELGARGINAVAHTSVKGQPPIAI